MTAKTAAAKKTAATTPKAQPEPAASEPAETKPARRGKPKLQHILYRETDLGDFADILVHGDKNRALEDLAFTHTGADGWKYIQAASGVSVRDAIQAAGR